MFKPPLEVVNTENGLHPDLAIPDPDAGSIEDFFSVYDMVFELDSLRYMPSSDLLAAYLYLGGFINSQLRSGHIRYLPFATNDPGEFHQVALNTFGEGNWEWILLGENLGFLFPGFLCVVNAADRMELLRWPGWYMLDFGDPRLFKWCWGKILAVKYELISFEEALGFPSSPTPNGTGIVISDEVFDLGSTGNDELDKQMFLLAFMKGEEHDD